MVLKPEALLTMLAWLLAGLSAAYWGLRWGADALPAGAPAQTGQMAASAGDVQAVARALGAGVGGSAGPAPVVAVSSNHRLLGVAVDSQGHGVALIAMDGEATRAYRLNATLPDGARVLELTRNDVVLGLPGGEQLRLQVPAPSVIPAPPPSASAPRPAVVPGRDSNRADANRNRPQRRPLNTPNS